MAPPRRIPEDPQEPWYHVRLGTWKTYQGYLDAFARLDIGMSPSAEQMIARVTLASSPCVTTLHLVRGSTLLHRGEKFLNEPEFTAALGRAGFANLPPEAALALAIVPDILNSGERIYFAMQPIADDEEFPMRFELSRNTSSGKLRLEAGAAKRGVVHAPADECWVCSLTPSG